MNKWHYLATLIAALSGIFSVFFIRAKKTSVDVLSDPTIPESEPEALPSVTIDYTQPESPPEAPKQPVEAPLPPKPTHSMLDTFCAAIAQFEGANPANNNPGNCRCSPVGYASIYGHVTCNPHGFAVFPTKELGHLYLENLVHHRAVLHPTWTIYNFFNNYAPSSDNNSPNHYAEWVAARCGVSPSVTLGKLLGTV